MASSNDDVVASVGSSSLRVAALRQASVPRYFEGNDKPVWELERPIQKRNKCCFSLGQLLGRCTDMRLLSISRALESLAAPWHPCQGTLIMEHPSLDFVAN